MHQRRWRHVGSVVVGAGSLVLVTLTNPACRNVEEEAIGTAEQRVYNGTCGAQFDDYALKGTCNYKAATVTVKGSFTFAGVMSADETAIVCTVTVPANSTSLCSANYDVIETDKDSVAKCGDAKVVSNCPRSIDVELKGLTMTFSSTVEPGFGASPGKPRTPEEDRIFLAKECMARFDKHKLDACQSLGLKLGNDTPACYESGRITTPWRPKCDDKIYMACCIPQSKDGGAEASVKAGDASADAADATTADAAAKAPVDETRTGAAACAAKLTNVECTTCCNQLFPNEAPGWQDCARPCGSKP